MNRTWDILFALPAVFLLAILFLARSAEIATGQTIPEVISTQLKVRPNIEVASAYVTLGDLFDNAGEKADVRVFRAPAPGQTGYIRASRVADAATRNGLTWVNKMKLPRVNVARLSHMISPEDITASIRNRIVSQDTNPASDGRIDLRFTRPPAPIHLPVTISSGFEVKQVRIDKISGRFSAIIETYAGNEAPAKQIVLTGLAVKTVELPVLSRNLARGEIIRPGDLELRNMPRAKINGRAVLRTADLIGMASRRTLRAGAPLRARDVEKPRIIRRNDLVTIVYRTAGLTLTTQGHALSDGSLGEMIPVRNSRSKRTIQVTVIGPRTVSPNIGPTLPITPAKTTASIKPGN